MYPGDFWNWKCMQELLFKLRFNSDLNIYLEATSYFEIAPASYFWTTTTHAPPRPVFRDATSFQQFSLLKQLLSICIKLKSLHINSTCYHRPQPNSDSRNHRSRPRRTVSHPTHKHLEKISIRSKQKKVEGKTDKELCHLWHPCRRWGWQPLSRCLWLGRT